MKVEQFLNKIEKEHDLSADFYFYMKKGEVLEGCENPDVDVLICKIDDFIFIVYKDDVVVPVIHLPLRLIIGDLNIELVKDEVEEFEDIAHFLMGWYIHEGEYELKSKSTDLMIDMANKIAKEDLELSKQEANLLNIVNKLGGMVKDLDNEIGNIEKDLDKIREENKDNKEFMDFLEKFEKEFDKVYKGRSYESK